MSLPEEVVVPEQPTATLSSLRFVGSPLCNPCAVLAAIYGPPAVMARPQAQSQSQAQPGVATPEQPSSTPLAMMEMVNQVASSVCAGATRR